jgi:hypothetical protein
MQGAYVNSFLIGMFLGIVLSMAVNFYIGLPDKPFDEKKSDKHLSKKDWEEKNLIK